MKRPFNRVGFSLIAGFFVGLFFSIFLVIEAYWTNGFSEAVGPTVFLFLYCMLCAILIPVYFKNSVKQIDVQVAFAQASLITTPAKVIEKNAQTTGGRWSTSYYTITFQFNDGNRKIFDVDFSVFSSLVENDTGILTYKEKDEFLFFVSFSRNM